MKKLDSVPQTPRASGALRGALKLNEAAQYLSVSKPTVHRLIKRGLIRPNRATRHLVFPIVELDRFLSQ